MTGSPRPRQASVIPSIDSESCHITSGCSGLPKLRQFTTAFAVAPTQARFATLSATVNAVPERRIERAPTRIGVRRERDATFGVRQARPRQAQQRGVAARADDRIQEELRVVLAIDPRGVDQEVQQVVVRRSDRFVIARVIGVDRLEARGAHHRSVVERGLVGQ